VVSYMRAEMRATAEAKGRRADIAEAMVDADIVIKDVIAKDKLLTLTSAKAVELKVADAEVGTFDEAIVLLNLGGAQKTDVETHWGEKIARVLTDPTVSSMLMTFGFLGLMMELYTPGFGIGGIIGATCLALFFLGQYAANMAGFEEVILFAVGFALLGLEIFVIPGFGVVGILGIVSIVTALGMSMVELPLAWDVSFELGYLQEAAQTVLVRLSITLSLLVIGGILFAKYLPGSFIGRRLIFNVNAPGDVTGAHLGAEAPGGSLPQRFDDLLGLRGVAMTVLRPSGVAEINGRRVHVLTEGLFVAQGTPVIVTQADGHRVVVQPVDET
ncbi:MAG: hypothetical protein R3C68_10780, partial [Myxococcota bacterium]